MTFSKSKKNGRVWALSNGVYSRETAFKNNNDIAEVLNLVVTVLHG